ncbi:hypothetical protein BDR03DRAFT_1019815 [Suillus americanus]|nr:hypothetical protein BDR03DRAFT_1019815 [Suillus americanus]
MIKILIWTHIILPYFNQSSLLYLCQSNIEEIALHEGQANDALHATRVHLGDKAVLFHNTAQSAKSQASSTRDGLEFAQ